MKNNVETKTYVVELLESYQKRSKQIELLHYELSHPTDISENEMIGALALAHDDGVGSGGHISDKTLYIAMNYQQRTKNANQGTRAEIVSQLIELEDQQERLSYYVSLLKARHAELLRLLYFEGYSQEECAKKLAIATRTVRRIKDDAIDELAEMYSFTGRAAKRACPEPVQ